MYIKLSYDFNLNTPYPSGLSPVEIEHNDDMAKGKISNVYTIKICNHVGTHIDGPRHFSMKKKALNEFDIDKFIFDRPAVIDIPKSDGQLICDNDLAVHKETICDCDLLLIRTGFSKIRSSNLQRYVAGSPGFAASAGQYAVEKLGGLQAIGMDTLSFATPQQLEEGIKAHQIMMNECDRDIFLLEDINLNFDLSGLKKVFALPLFVEELDSAPCTVLALIEKEAL